MAILTLRNITLHFGEFPLLDNAALTINPRERICLIGRNGAGKSTLLKIIEGAQPLDSGERVLSSGVSIARLTQAVPTDITGSVFDVVKAGLTEYHQYDTYLVDALLTRLDIDKNLAFSSLSGGLKRRVLLAQAVVCEPDILLLDEPTNHLDINAIEWLENFLLSFKGSIVFITHDRAFLKKLATRIVELDRGQLTAFDGPYDKFLTFKAQQLDEEERHNALFDKRLANEERWIRQGIKARRTRNEGRVRALEKMRVTRQRRQNQQGCVSLTADVGKKSGQKVIEAKSISFMHTDRPIINNLSITIMRGDKIGILGPNGCGKSTLLNMLLKTLSPSAGTVEHGTHLDIAYFDQLRDQLDDNLSLQDNVGGGSEFIDINGKPQHVLSYLQDFLFSPARSRAKVHSLSGGERNRLLLAKILAKPTNVLVLDEPTNDLDIETLELLESLLVNYTGTLLLVSHDRAFINNVVTSTLVFEENGNIQEYVGGYDDWLRQSRSPVKKSSTVTRTTQPKKTTSKNKLSYKDSYRLEQLPKDIEALEKEITTLSEKISTPDFYQQEQSAIQDIQAKLKAKETALSTAYSEWEALLEKQG